VLKFGDGDFVLRFGHVPHFKHRHFGTGTIITGCSSGSTSHGGSGRGTIVALPLKIGMAFHGHRQSMPGSQGGQGGGRHGGAPPEALLQQLEAMGFRHVPELLGSRDP
jgi:hypothetical protein